MLSEKITKDKKGIVDIAMGGNIDEEQCCSNSDASVMEALLPVYMNASVVHMACVAM